MNNVRVRYAPSPTGLQHIGGLRTALFNYLLARAYGGQFYLRIEDTDQTRYNPEAVDDLYDTLRWAGLDWDEGPDRGGPFGPYIQSQRLELYRETAERLIAEGHAYRCFCTPERLTELRTWQEQQHLPSGYDRRCRSLSPDEAQKLAREGNPYVIRFIQTEAPVAFEDEILGKIEKAGTDLPIDPVLLKSDGYPTYHLAHVTDDHLMQTTHVLRAQEWLPSAPLHVQLFDALGWPRPKYVHLPLILGSDGQKLSKRHGATSVRQFKESGYLPAALVNYLALLGWSAGGDREFFTLAELEKLFSLDRLNKSPGVFDYKKLEHFNATYLRGFSEPELAALLLEEASKAGLTSTPATEAEKRQAELMAPLVRERLTFLNEAPGMLRFVFAEPTPAPVADLIPKKGTAETAASILAAVIPLVSGSDERTSEATEELFRAKAEELGLKLGDFMHPVRVAVSGSKVSPPMFGSMKAVGEARVKARLEAAWRLLTN
ncbi:MAG: glutamate--tRNA ligase [Spirochaetales bacterium]|nr:glutamate--tRNA ligase [Spirochaetales bacterium]